jgi:hypothetical protein
MIFSSLPPAQPTARAHRRFRLFVGLLVLAVVVLLVLQYTPLHPLPERKTSSLWGALVGLVAMTAIVEYGWSDARHD